MGRLTQGRPRSVPHRIPDSTAPGLIAGLPVPAAAQGMEIRIVGNRDYRTVSAGVERRFLHAHQA